MVSFLKSLFSKKDPETCTKCSGHGLVKNCKEQYKELCPQCKGRGKLDWLEKILGKNIENEQHRPIDFICKKCGGSNIGSNIGFTTRNHVALFTHCLRCGTRGISEETWVGED